ncbi:lipase family protein [Desulfomicrobium salsuginis]
MQIVPIRCFQRRCLRLKIVDFENTPITDLVHPETGEEVGDLRIVAYDADGLPLGEYVYAKGASTLDLCRMDRGWAYLEFKPLPRDRPHGYPGDEEWDQLTLAADIIAHKALKASAGNGLRPNEQTLPEDSRSGWNYHRVSHGALNLPRRMERIEDRMEETRPKQHCAMRFLLTEQERRCLKCSNLQTSYLLELAPLFCWIPALVTSRVGAADDWDSITANNLGAFSALAYAEPDTRSKSGLPNGERAPYDHTILYTLDNLRTQRVRPYRVNADRMDMVLHEMPYSWHYHDMQFIGPKLKSKNPTDSQAFIATNRDTILIAVRGTEGLISHDMVLNSKFIRQPCPEALASAGSAHHGFLQAFEYLWPVVEDYCKKHRKNSGDESKRIFVTGHSLGGAMATLLTCAIYVRFKDNPVTLYTYASPRVGDIEFARHWNHLVPHLRHVYRNDIIPAVPPASLGYHHFGHLQQMTLAKFESKTSLWIGDYGLHQVESAIERKRRYKGDNAPWGPAESTGYWTTENSFSELFQQEMRKTLSPMSGFKDLSGIRFHFMASEHIPFLQQELRQRYEYARSGRPLLSRHIPADRLDRNDDFNQELLAYMRPVTLAELLDRHVSELVSLETLEDEVVRFCRDTVQLGEMARQELDAERREKASKSCHARRFETSLEVSRVMEMKEGLSPGFLQAAYEAESKGTQYMADEFMRQCVAQEYSEFA